MKSNIIKLLYTLILVLIFSISCKHKKERSIEVNTMYNTHAIDRLKELVLLNGDTAAYDELEIALLNNKYKDEYLVYSIVMADKYKYPRAYFQVYYCLISVFEHHAGKMDEEAKALAIKYLKKGVDLNDCQSTKELGNLYLDGEYVPKDTILGKKLQAEGRKLCGF